MITTMDGLVAALASGQRLPLQKASITTVSGYYYTLWTASGNPPVGSSNIGNTTSGLIPTDATIGAPTINAFTGSNTGYLGGFDASSAQTGVLSMYDRLWHAGAFSGTTLQTVTLSGQPTLTRVPGDNYSQLELWLEVVATFSATNVTVTVSYMDGDGATQTATLDTTLTGAPINRMLPFRLANSKGIQKVLSVTTSGSAASTGTFNLVIQRNIVDHTVVSANIGRPKKNAFDTGMPVVYADSCLALMWLAAASSSGVLFAEATIING